MEFNKELEDYFNYRWSSNKNNAVSTQQDIDLLEQLPFIVQFKIFSEFLFKHFLFTYRDFFKGLAKEVESKFSKLIQDDNYQELLIKIL